MPYVLLLLAFLAGGLYLLRRLLPHDVLVRLKQVKPSEQED
jgi:hypothetical protein